MRIKKIAAGVAAAALLAGCVTQPEGPTVDVMPGQGKSFADFRHDDRDCQDFASDRVAGRADSANDHAILSAIIGAGLGAALGGAIGGGNGAGIGAAAGGVAGTAYGANQSDYAQGNLQRRYNIAYAQCMAAKGNDVPDMGPRWHHRDRGGYGPPPPDE
jgi:hypothetical protein